MEWYFFGATLLVMSVFITHFVDRLIISRALSIEEIRYGSLFEHNSDAVFELDRQGRFITTNLAGEQLFGYTKEELLKITFQPLIQPADIERTIQYFEGALCGQSEHYEITCIHKDGYTREISGKNIPLVISGKVVGVYAIVRDISMDKTRQKVLEESEERYRKLMEHAPTGIILHQNGTILYANGQACNLMFEEDPIGKSIWSFMDADQQQISVERIKEIQEGRELTSNDFTLLNRDGEILHCIVSSTLIPLGENQAIITYFNDVTDRKKAEEALRESEEKFRMITMKSQDMVKIVDRQGKIVFASPSHLTILGYHPEELMEQQFSTRVHPDDKQFHSKFVQTIKSGEECCFEYRRQHKNGDWVWIESLVTPVRNDEGIVERVVVTSRDITERKYYETELMHLAFHDPLTGLTNRRYFQQLIEQSIKEAIRYERSLAVMYMDLDKFKQINDTYGHDIGDELLKELALRLRKCVRDSDTVARLGGDEFSILLPNLIHADGAIHVAEKIVQTMQIPWSIKGHEFKMTSSIGISVFPRDGDETEQLIKRADIALFEAKRNGRNHYQLFSNKFKLNDF